MNNRVQVTEYPSKVSGKSGYEVAAAKFHPKSIRNHRKSFSEVIDDQNDPYKPCWGWLSVNEQLTHRDTVNEL